MSKLSNMYQSGDWKNEKHVPTIIAPESAKKGEVVEVRVAVGEDIAHPNTLEHHISWIKVYFLAEGAKFPVELGTYDFNAHGENEIFAEPNVTLRFKAEASGKVLASSYCNIHGLWEDAVELEVK